MVNGDSIRKMRTGVVLVNPARGELFDHQAVLEGLKEGKIGALAMDVYEDEKNYLRKDLKGESTGDAVFDQLISREDVFYTAHTASLIGAGVSKSGSPALKDNTSSPLARRSATISITVRILENRTSSSRFAPVNISNSFSISRSLFSLILYPLPL